MQKKIFTHNIYILTDIIKNIHANFCLASDKIHSVCEIILNIETVIVNRVLAVT